MSTHLDEAEFRSGGTLPDGTPEPPIHPLVRFSVKNYVFSIGIFVMVVLLGLVSTFRLGVELLPNFEVPVLAVSTTYPGANPDQVDREVSRRVEDAFFPRSATSRRWSSPSATPPTSTRRPT
ncbi:efflux RND transporter permease subunit, partial [Deinococcus wulumuqiensis]